MRFFWKGGKLLVFWVLRELKPFLLFSLFLTRELVETVADSGDVEGIGVN